MRLIFSDVAWRGKTISIGNSMTVESLIESTNSSGKFRENRFQVWGNQSH